MKKNYAKSFISRWLEINWLKWDNGSVIENLKSFTVPFGKWTHCSSIKVVFQCTTSKKSIPENRLSFKSSKYDLLCLIQRFQVICTIENKNPVALSWASFTIWFQLFKDCATQQINSYSFEVRVIKTNCHQEDSAIHSMNNWDQGPVSRKSRKLFGPGKPFVKLWRA